MPELELGPLRFGIVGAGRLGCAVGRALQASGLEVVAASSASPAGRERATQLLGVPTFADPAAATDGVDVVLVCVPDDALAGVARQLADDPRPSAAGTLRVVHTSGCHGLGVLEPVRAAGLDVLSLHPLQTVTDGASPLVLRGAAAAVTAHDVATTTFGHALAHALGMHPFDLPDEARPLYHAASSFAANFTVTVLAAVRDIARAAGIGDDLARNAFSALARSAVDRVEELGADAALTGPIVRGDLHTVELHLAALDAALPQHRPTYEALARATVQLAVGAGRLPVDAAARFDATLTRPATGRE